MIPIPRSSLSLTNAQPAPGACIVGVGNAGVALVDALTLAGAADHTQLVALNTDSVSLGTSVAAQKLLIGSNTTRGLGSGGDPELGAKAAEEGEAEIANVMAQAGLVILCCGLGGGTGSGAAPVIAEIAGRSGAVVVSIVTLPFAFEGKRRMQQAMDALHDLSHSSHAVLTFENDRISELAQPMAGMHETFAASDQMLADSVAALLRLVSGAGRMRVSLADIQKLFEPGQQTALFGTAAAQGGNRANQSVERLMKSPLLRDKHLTASRHVIFHIEASSALRFVEVETAARVLEDRIGPNAQIHLALTSNDELGDSMVVSVFATTGAALPEPVRHTQPPVEHIPSPAHDVPRDENPQDDEESPVVSAVPVEPAMHKANAELFNTEPFTLPKEAAQRKSAKPKQETLGLDSVARGRFEKSEPTIVGGEDLDVPTFVRQKIKLR
jgi:cell division protein FtsZ